MSDSDLDELIQDMELHSPLRITTEDKIIEYSCDDISTDCVNLRPKSIWMSPVVSTAKRVLIAQQSSTNSDDFLDMLHEDTVELGDWRKY